MVTKKAMAAQFTDVTLEEMKTFINRAFRALHPRMSVIKGETVFDLFMSPKAGIRVWTSIAGGGSSGAGLGEDAIRVQLYSFDRQRPLKPGKAPIVKRTQGWKDNLTDRIESAMEDFDRKEEDIEAGRFVDWSK